MAAKLVKLSGTAAYDARHKGFAAVAEVQEDGARSVNPPPRIRVIREVDADANQAVRKLVATALECFQTAEVAIDIAIEPFELSGAKQGARRFQFTSGPRS